MLKKFFTVFLGSMAAAWVTILLLGVIIIAAIYNRFLRPEEIKIESNSVLCIDLNGSIPERRLPMTANELLFGYDSGTPTMDEIRESLDRAVTDYRIKGVYIRLRGSSMGLAQREELGRELANFKSKSGKWVIAYADNYSQGDYYTATVADEVYINPYGRLTADGMSVSVPYFKGILDKLGIDIQVIRVGDFKSAVEPYTRTAMSDSARIQYQRLLDDMWNTYTEDVVANLKTHNDSVTVSRFSAMSAAPMMGYNADELVKAHLFTGAKYSYEVARYIKGKAGASGNEEWMVTPQRYLASFETQEPDKEDPTKYSHIAVIFAEGDIVDTGTDMSGDIIGDRLTPLIARMADDPKVKGLVLRVNSGGGSAFASEQIWSALEYFKSKKKTFVVSMGDVAASGGYYISAGADRIFAEKGTITGSIGIFGIIPYAQELLNDKLGITFSVVQTNDNAAFPRLDAPLTPQQHAALEKMITSGYDLFVSRVAAGRNMTVEQVDAIAGGRVWAGLSAKEIGLIDEFGGLQEAINYVASKSGLTASSVVGYPILESSALDAIAKLAGDREKPFIDSTSSTQVLQSLGLTPKEIKQVTDVLTRMRNMNTIQAKMEDMSVEF